VGPDIAFGARYKIQSAPLMDESEVYIANSVFVELGGLSMNDWFPKTPNVEGLPKK